MADGTPYVLPQVHLAMSGIEEVDLNAALAQAPSAVQAHISSFGSVSVSYRHDWQGVLVPTMSILDVSRSLGYAPPFVFPAKAWPENAASAPPWQTYEGLWWRYGAGSAGFVALANTTDKAIGIELGVSGLKSPAGRSLTLGAHRTAMIDLKDFFAGDDARIGGVRIVYQGPWGAVHVAGGLEDAAKGFSTDLPLILRVPSTETPGPRQRASVGVMVNQQDPLLNFPGSVSFIPYAFFRNVSTAPKTLHFGLYYMEGRNVKSLPLPDLALQAGEAQELPIGSAMVKQPQIQDINLSFSYDGYWGDILAGVGSIDQTGNYVFPVPPKSVYKGGARASAYWLAEGGFDTMYTVWNPEPEAQELLLTLKYGSTGESYKLPLTLEPFASAMIDIGELVRTRQLDQDGRLLPQEVKRGSLLVSSPANDPGDAIDVVLSGGIYNPTKATCSPRCNTCQGFTNITCSPTSFTIPVNGQQGLTYGYSYSSGGWYSLAYGASWSSGAPGVMTVQNGVATGVSPGNASWLATSPDWLPPYIYQYCSWNMCPTVPAPNCGGTGTVTPHIDSVGPSQVGVGNSAASLTLTGSGFGASPTVNISDLPPHTGSGSDTSTSVTIDTTGATLGDHQVTVTVNGQTSNPKTLTIVCAVPTNFQLADSICFQDGELDFLYSFQSSTGTQSDIAACYVGELVTYNGAPQSPPFPQNSGYTSGVNPDLRVIVGQTNTLQDRQKAPSGSFLPPYSNAVFVGGQIYRYNCPCQGQPGVYTSFPGYTSVPITRQVTNASGVWQYVVSKQGYTCSLNLP